MKKAALTKVDALYPKKDVPKFNTGDTVKVMQRVIEGSKTRCGSCSGVNPKRIFA